MDKIGHMNYRVVFEDRIDSFDEYGNIKHPDQWGGVATDHVWNVVNVWVLPNVWNIAPTEEEAALWADFKPRFGRELIEGGGISNKTQGVLTIRYHPTATLNILPSYRCRFLSGPYKGKSFNILAVSPMSDRRFVEINLQEQPQ